MPDIVITFKPTLQRLSDAFKNANIANALATEINVIAEKVTSYGKQLSPVDTGALRASIRQTIFSRPTNLKAVVESGVNYAIYVHEGTKKMLKVP